MKNRKLKNSLNATFATFQFEKLRNGRARSQQQWLPYEPPQDSMKCQLTCFSRETLEYYQTGENVVDGTRCSYDESNDICVQGKCVQLGCDMVSIT